MNGFSFRTPWTSFKGARQSREFDLHRFPERAVSLTDAIEASHEVGIVHRDLKPANIMIDKDGSIRVLDFGLLGVVCSDVPDGSRAILRLVAWSHGGSGRGHTSAELEPLG